MTDVIDMGQWKDAKRGNTPIVLDAFEGKSPAGFVRAVASTEDGKECVAVVLPSGSRYSTGIAMSPIEARVLAIALIEEAARVEASYGS